ncbi:MAG: ATP-binding protein [Smithellaceae bacterium]
MKGLWHMEATLPVEKLHLIIQEQNEKMARTKQEMIPFKQLLGMIPDGLMVVDVEGKILFVNPGMAGIFGCGSDEMTGRHYADPRWRIACVEDGQANEDPVFGWIVQAGRPLTGKICVMESQAGWKKMLSIDARPCFDDAGKLFAIAAFVKDISEQSRLKGEHQEIKDVYERLTRYADMAILRVEAVSGRVTYLNEATRKILGYSLEEFSSDPKLAMKVFQKDYIRNWIRAVDAPGDGGDVIKNVHVECTAKDGRTVVMEFTAIAVRGADGCILHFEALGRDMTVRRFMEAELAKAQKLESIGLLAGGIAHDFNNILTSVFGSLALAKMEVATDGSVYKRLTAAEEHCLRAKNLTRKLLTYSRGGSPQRKTASIATVLREAVGFTLSGKNIQCSFDLPDGLWSAQIDEGQMHQVIHSLVTNAAEAMPLGGAIDVGARNVTLTAEQVPALSDGRYVQWYVRDHGMGISREHLKKLFDPYFTTKQMGSVKGMGLGLAIAYSIVKSHEGMITVESTPGAGTTFTVYVPASNGEKHEVKPEAAREKPFTGKHKIMLIDDEQILLDVTGSMLTHLGYDVTTAKSHEDALDIYAQSKEANAPFSLVIMDLTMRGDEGGETAIRHWQNAHPEVKAIISSGYMNDPVIEEYWKYGFVGAMVKPYSLVDLKDTLEKILTPKSD